MKVALVRAKQLKKQQKIQEQQKPPTRKKVFNECSRLAYGALFVYMCITFIRLLIVDISFGTVSFIDYTLVIFAVGIGLFGVYLLGYGTRNLVRMGRQWCQLKRGGELKRSE